MKRLMLAIAAFAIATPALAAGRAPEPLKPLDLDRFMGRWYEILRTPNDVQKNCHAAYQVWVRKETNRFSIAQSCHKDSPTGPVRTIDTGAKLIDLPNTAKFEASFFAGLIRRQYWVLDRADDYSWMIASTSNGAFAALLSRKPGMSAAEEAMFRKKIAAMGLDEARLVSVGAR